MMRPVTRLLLAASASVLAASSALAQNTITLEGAVRADGNPVAGAQITVRNIATSEISRATTRPTGEFRVLGLYTGRYTVNVRSLGYRQATDTVELVIG